MLAMSDFLNDTDISMLSLISLKSSVDGLFFFYVDNDQSIKFYGL